MMPHIWLNKGFSANQGFAAAVRSADPHVLVSLSHVDDRPEITGSSSMTIDKEPEVLTGIQYIEYALDVIGKAKSRGMPITALLATRHRQALAENKDTLEQQGVRVCAGSSEPDLLKICENKYKFSMKLKEAGIPVPETIEVISAAEARRAIREIENFGYEVCVKPSVGVLRSRILEIL